MIYKMHSIVTMFTTIFSFFLSIDRLEQINNDTLFIE